MRGGKLNEDLQEYGILNEYRRAIHYGNRPLANAIKVANPQVHLSKFERVEEEEHGTNSKA